MEEKYEMITIEDCPLCFGPAVLEEEANGFYVACLDCGAQSVSAYYRTEEGKLEAAKKTALLWNAGKVIKSQWGE